MAEQNGPNDRPQADPDPGDGELVEQVRDLLARVRRWNWRTTSGLASELGIERERLWRVLRAHVSRGDRIIRHHARPSRRMETLWGLIERVGEDPDLPPLTRADYPEADDGLAADVAAAAPLVFVSHSHRDGASALEIARELAQAGVEPWLYKTGIEVDQAIIAAVDGALRQARAFTVYVSGRSLGSQWVHKEFGFVLAELGISTLVVLDGGDAGLLECFDTSLARDGSHRKVKQYARTQAERLQPRSPDDWVRIAANFGAGLFEYLEKGGCAAFYPRPPQGGPASPPGATTLQEWASSLV